MGNKNLGLEYPNFKILTDYLITKRHPRRTLCATISLAKPLINGVDNDHQKSNVRLCEIAPGGDQPGL